MKIKTALRSIAITTSLVCLVLSYQNCSNGVSNGYTNLPMEGNGALGTGSGGSGVARPNTKLDCQFAGVNVLTERMKTLLQIPAADVPVLDQNGRPTNAMRLASNAATLGKGDVARGTFDDLSCGTTKFKAAGEVMMDACAVALADTALRAKLFPQGAQNFDVIYTAFLGRLPTAGEKAILLNLVEKVATAKREAAACAAVASSLESLIRI